MKIDLSNFSEDQILYNPLVSPLFKAFTLSKLITNGILSQYIGNAITFESWSDAWIFKGLSHFLAYEISGNDELFISEVLHPTLQLQSFSSEFPFSADEALGDEVTEKGEKLRRFSRSRKFQCHSRCEIFPLFSFQLLALFE